MQQWLKYVNIHFTLPQQPANTILLKKSCTPIYIDNISHKNINDHSNYFIFYLYFGRISFAHQHSEQQMDIENNVWLKIRWLS